MKGQIASKAKWYTREKVQEKFSSLHSVEAFGDQRPPKMRRCDPD